MAWKTVVIKNGEKINLFLNNLVIWNESKNYQIPLDDINCVLIENYSTLITTRILDKMADFKIITIICDPNFVPKLIMQPLSGNHLQYKIQQNQLNWDKNKKLALWTKIIENKLISQIDVLKMNLKNIQKIQMIYRYVEELKFADSSNREGHAAKVYFRELFGKDFNRDAENHVNSALNYGYTIIRSAFIRGICAKGLNPIVSLFHHNMYNSFALADDLMEPFRPIVDDLVFKKIFNKETFTRNDKSELVNILNSKIIFLNKEMYFTDAVNQYVDMVINYFDIQNHELSFPIVSSVKYYEL